MTAATVFKENKLVFSLRIFTIVAAIVGCCLHGWALKLHNYVYTDGVGALYEIIPLAGLGMSFLFSSIALFVALTFADPIHPAIFLTLDLICGLYLIGSGIGVATSEFNDTVDFSCYGTSAECDGISPKLVGVRWTGTTFSFLNALIHLFLFATACAACHRWRKRSNTKRDTFVEMDPVGQNA